MQQFVGRRIAQSTAANIYDDDNKTGDESGDTQRRADNQ